MRWNRGCLFKESCSRCVYRVTVTLGLRQGIRVLYSRYRQCRPGYSICTASDGLRIQLADGTCLTESEADPEIFRPVLAFASQREVELNAEGR